MSYQDLARNGGPGRSSETRPLLQPLGTMFRLVEGLLLKVANNIAGLKKQVDILGTARDTVDHRHRLAATNTTIQDLARQIKDTLTRDAAAMSSAPPADQQKHMKLLQDFAASLQDYKATQKIAANREAATLPRPNPVSAMSAAAVAAGQQGGHVEVVIEQQALVQAQLQRRTAAREAEMAHNEALIEERDTGIRDIVRQIGEVNEMFQDLAVLINDQGVQVQTIDEQITHTAERTEDGARELVKADRSQRAYRNKCLWLWFVAAIVVSIILVLMFA
mmetsp:Transcript_10399/g.18107  ORF Transcript_10399/g.18107 Transcript_10399/m.18107 type:complete len:277 (+) Transcript_10399:108-938(+)|eukprot:CAMPEP_0119102178 /NCGR_PEP_ID=MMETSP1180-20130426/1019_1 /TAXON_ID=3052 ORGANISM="Chlamydomonas cf sp, Strain CCMP681" /NCGR_SAMPLE_ID=MMETSP1180 /ASSEMBLY_ACC=CAM_ASM_000741 /LENGTH=276 /DNA_ID=CAMNT_0007086421 /DNA_START=102 /DNA_END=932 /DNA_ORIENTATION=+